MYDQQHNTFRRVSPFDLIQLQENLGVDPDQMNYEVLCHC